MANNVVNLEQARGGTDVATSDLNPYEQYGNSVSNRNIIGQLLKFSKGDWLAGEDQEEIEAGTQLVADMESLSIGWVRWQDNKPDQQIMGLVKDMYRPPLRATLGDHDEEKWETDNNGNPRDPWQFSNYLVLKLPGETADEENLFTFATSSKGGLGAVGELCKVYGKAMRSRPDEFPIVALQVDSYMHPNKEFGRIKFPIFEVVGWEKKEVGLKAAEEKAPPKKAAAKAEPKKAPPKKTSRR